MAVAVHEHRFSRKASPPRQDGLFFDAPLKVHAPKLVLWWVPNAVLVPRHHQRVSHLDRLHFEASFRARKEA